LLSIDDVEYSFVLTLIRNEQFKYLTTSQANEFTKYKSEISSLLDKARNGRIKYHII